MHSFYLRNMYMKNLLREPGALTLGGTKIDLSKVTTPAYFVSAIEDHIAPWKTTYAGTELLGGKNRFVLSGRATSRHGESAAGEQVRLLDQRQAAGRARRAGSPARSSTRLVVDELAHGLTPYLGAKCPRASRQGQAQGDRGRPGTYARIARRK
jgi:hypothetical protein